MKYRIWKGEHGLWWAYVPGEDYVTADTDKENLRDRLWTNHEIRAMPELEEYTFRATRKGSDE